MSISGYMWIGRNLVPRLLFYSLFFLGIVVVEVTIISFQFFFGNQTPNITLYYLIATNAIAFILFLKEGLLLRHKTRPEKTTTKTFKIFSLYAP